jgi:hypothetical protein
MRAASAIFCLVDSGVVGRLVVSFTAPDSGLEGVTLAAGAGLPLLAAAKAAAASAAAYASASSCALRLASSLSLIACFSYSLSTFGHRATFGISLVKCRYSFRSDCKLLSTVMKDFINLRRVLSACSTAGDLMTSGAATTSTCLPLGAVFCYCCSVGGSRSTGVQSKGGGSGPL